MKTFTYTQMRSELSDILDLLRSGESITITQRGKPDIIVYGLDDVKNNNTQTEQKEALILSPEFTEGIQKVGKQLEGLLNSPEVKEGIVMVASAAMKLHNFSEEFATALLHTQTKHAEIIKKLEDK